MLGQKYFFGHYFELVLQPQFRCAFARAHSRATISTGLTITSNMTTNRPEILQGVLSPGEIMTIEDYVQTLDRAGAIGEKTVALKITVMLPVNADGSDPSRCIEVEVNVNAGIFDECQRNRQFMRRYIDELSEEPKRQLMEAIGNSPCSVCDTDVATRACAVQDLSFADRRLVIRQVRLVCDKIDCIKAANARTVEFTEGLQKK